MNNYNRPPSGGRRPVAPRGGPVPGRSPAPGRTPTPGRVPGRKTTTGGSSGGLNIIMLLVTAVLGGLSWLLCDMLYSAVSVDMPRTLLIALLFSILALVVVLGVYGVTKLQHVSKVKVAYRAQRFPTPVLIAGIVACMAVVAALGQWIYSLRMIESLSDGTSYIFLIDDSKSMTGFPGNDRQNLRYQAIEDVLADKDPDFPYMVYSYGANVVIRREMLPISAGNALNDVSADGGSTYTKTALQQVFSDYQNGRWDGGLFPKVILLSDGEAHDVTFTQDIDGTLIDYKDAGINISTVGLGENIDRTLMQTVADRTHGVFVDVEDASGLSTAMNSAATLKATDDLVTTRYPSKLGFIYGIIRVIILTLMGLAIGFISSKVYGQNDSESMILISSAVTAFLGALILEVGTSVFELSDRLCWLILWILMAATFCRQGIHSQYNQDVTVTTTQEQPEYTRTSRW